MVAPVYGFGVDPSGRNASALEGMALVRFVRAR
jgi:hypothetical protein